MDHAELGTLIKGAARSPEECPFGQLDITPPCAARGRAFFVNVGLLQASLKQSDCLHQVSTVRSISACATVVHYPTSSWQSRVVGVVIVAESRQLGRCTRSQIDGGSDLVSSGGSPNSLYFGEW